jgi:hypothetical protein
MHTIQSASSKIKHPEKSELKAFVQIFVEGMAA